jgi:putative nucleotidyltransferase with HDIG domain
MNLEILGVNETKVSVSDLKIGMYVSRLDKDWSQSSFLLQGLLIESEADIKKLTQECSYVYIEENKEVLIPPVKTNTKEQSTHAHHPRRKEDSELIIDTAYKVNREQTVHLNDIINNTVSAESIKPPKKTRSFSHEMGIAKLAHNKTSALLKNMMTDVKASSATVDMLVAEQAIHDCMDSVLRSPDAMLLAMNLKGKHHNVWQHGMNVSMLAINLGRHLNLADEELVTLGLCGMFHDIGNLLISKKDIENAGDKRELIRSHTILGGDLLSKSEGELSGEVAQAAYAHHEHLDGSGFPYGLKEGDISPFTRIVSIADLYETLTTDTPHHKGLTHYEAMIYLLKEADKNHLDATLVNSFNQCIGTYPVGCYVEMNTGEIGVVVEANAEQRLKPIVMLLTTPDKKERPKQLVNLAKASFDGHPNTYAIKNIVDPEQYHIEL